MIKHILAACIWSLVCSVPLLTASYSPIAVRNVTILGAQLTPDVQSVSRDGGHSVLINGNVVWLYDDTECRDSKGKQLSFVSNTAAISTSPNDNITLVRDFGVVNLGREKDGSPKNAILADTSVGTGGWIPFQPDELQFNREMNGKERVAIWPGTPPTPISTEQAFLYAPLVYVDYKPQDPSKEYQGRGMTLVSITAPPGGPIAMRQGDLVIPGTQVGFGGFSTLVGRKFASATSGSDDLDRDLYLFGVTNAGLQLARVAINDLVTFSEFSFWEPHDRKFTNVPPKPGLIDNTQIYMPGTFSSGSVFFSPYLRTFIMVYFNKRVDSTFYIRFLDLSQPLTKDKVWKNGGKHGEGLEAEDAEALVRYSWSPEQKLWASPPGKGGFNYAGIPHPEFFNREYFAKSLYPLVVDESDKRNDWYGSDFVSLDDADGQDGKFLLLSWTSQKKEVGIYEVQLAVVEFDQIPDNPEDDKNGKTKPPKFGPSASMSSTALPPTRTDELGRIIHGTETPPADPREAARFLFDKLKSSASSELGERGPRLQAFVPIIVVSITSLLIRKWMW